MARKPSGTTGPIRVAVAESSATLNHQPVQWSTDQKGVERKILDYFIRESQLAGARVLHVQDGGTKDLDFLLTLPGGKCHLELMEAVLPNSPVPFQPGHMRHEPVPYARRIFDSVQKKIDKYGLKHQVPIDLLIYVTHEQYNPNDAAIWVLRRMFAEVAHPFEYAFFLVPRDENHAELLVLFNKDQPFDLPPLNALADREWFNLVGSEAVLSFHVDPGS